MTIRETRDDQPPESADVPEPASFEQELMSLEQAVRQLESGELSLSDALEAFEQGVRHVKTCHQRLDAAERKIERLMGVDADGNPVTEAFDDECLSLEEKQVARSRRRTQPAAKRANHPSEGE